MTLKISSHKRKPNKVQLSQDEITDVLYKVAREVAPKYRFGYHSNEDMIQEAVIKGLDVLRKGKFNPKGEKDLARQLSAFMRVNMRNHLSNMVRDKSCRYTSRDSLINKAKYNIMHPLYIYNQNLKEDFFVQSENDRNELHDCLEYIRVNLSDNQLVDFDLIRDGKKLSISKRNKLMAAIEQLFEDVDNEENSD